MKQNEVEIESSEDQLQQLKDSLEMIEELLDNAYHGMVLVDHEGRIIKWNYEKLMGIKEEEVLMRPVEEIIENTRLHIVAKTGEKELFDVQKIQGYDMITSRIPIVKDGRVIGAAGTVLFKDVKELESLVKRMKVLESTVDEYRGEIKRLHRAKYSFEHIVTQNRQMIYLKELARKAAESNSTVLIQGESGTGKEFFAHAIHRASLRRYGSFITINCAAIPNELLESELFGYDAGAFTGAKKQGKVGKFELGNGGTIVLDEIGAMPLEMQAKILRILESREFERIGGNDRIQLDVRIIAATNEPLEEAIKEGRFRQDLYYRLNVIPIEIPPLRERIEDIPILAQRILEKLAVDLGIEMKELTFETIEVLKKYQWPGNVRELRNTLERALNIVQGDMIYPEDLPGHLIESSSKSSYSHSLLLKDIMAKTEIEAIQSALRDSNGNKSVAAKQLGIHRTALYKKIQAYEMNK
ncbi:sigma-54 interaction domain-containing protein [Alkaliphilus metalliredigens]|nr:sigma 54-interacting transcriptional regulator [Alkaliphilus metalliredigens]